MRGRAPDLVGDCFHSLLTATQICPIVGWELPPKGFTDSSKFLIENNNKMELQRKKITTYCFFFCDRVFQFAVVVEIQKQRRRRLDVHRLLAFLMTQW